MPKKDDDLIFDTPSLKPDREAIIDKQFDNSNNTKHREKHPPKDSLFKNLVLLFLCLAILALTWNTLEMKQELSEYQSALSKADMRIYELETRSQKTSETQDLTINEIAGHLKIFDKEIRKLWDNVWAKSKIRFSSIEKSLKDNKKSLTEFAETKNQLIALGKEHQKTLKAMTKDIEKINPELSTIKEHTKKLAKIEQEIQSSVDKISALQTIKSEQKDIQERLNSVDSFRRQVNEQLEQIRKHLGL